MHVRALAAALGSPPGTSWPCQCGCSCSGRPPALPHPRFCPVIQLVRSCCTLLQPQCDAPLTVRVCYASPMQPGVHYPLCTASCPCWRCSRCAAVNANAGSGAVSLASAHCRCCPAGEPACLMNCSTAASAALSVTPASCTACRQQQPSPLLPPLQLVRSMPLCRCLLETEGVAAPMRGLYHAVTAVQ